MQTNTRRQRQEMKKDGEKTEGNGKTPNKSEGNDEAQNQSGEEKNGEGKSD